jgi:uncharacterized membrane protein affecting hemolysin expression
MNTDNLLVIAIVVFSLVLIGIVLTVVEFKNSISKQQESENKAPQKTPRRDG